MRGKANPDSPGTQAYRITPAYAGKSWTKTEDKNTV